MNIERGFVPPEIQAEEQEKNSAHKYKEKLTNSVQELLKSRGIKTGTNLAISPELKDIPSERKVELKFRYHTDDGEGQTSNGELPQNIDIKQLLENTIDDETPYEEAVAYLNEILTQKIDELDDQISKAESSEEKNPENLNYLKKQRQGLEDERVATRVKGSSILPEKYQLGSEKEEFPKAA